MSAPGAPTRVAIVGGGPAALAAAFELTSGDRAGRYDVTIFQQGWRPGGKCAAGRSPIAGGGERIEEHGLHIFFGCYANTRIVVERCLNELRDSADPYAFRSFDDAFESVDHIVLGQRGGTGWDFVELEFPRNPRAPVNFGDFVADALRWATGRLHQLLLLEGLADAPVHEERWSAAAPILRELDLDEPDPGARIGGVTAAMSRLQRDLTSLFMDIQAAARGPEHALDQLRELVHAVLPDRPQASPEVRFFLDTVDLLRALLRGVWQSGALEQGFDAINDVDLARWLEDHGLELADDPEDWPALLRAVYDGCFAFVGGDPGQPEMAAGRAVQGAIRCLFHYEGSVLYRPRSSMSDSVIGPLARILRQRGVDIRYFHAVSDVRVTEDRRRIAGIEVVEQVPTTSDTLFTSERYLEPDGEGTGTLETWPSVPPPDVLPAGAQGAEPTTLLEQEIDPFGGRRSFIDAADPVNGFDELILAVPPDVQREICKPLIAADEDYAGMLEESNSVVTQAAQIWLDQTASKLGQEFTSASLLSCFVEPLDTYADMAHLIAAERWPPDVGVQHVAYFCGVLPHAGLETQQQADTAVRAQVEQFLDNDAREFWPHAVDEQTFSWSTLVPDPPTDPKDRIYLRANFAPTERYILTLPGTVGQRLSARGTQFDNLVLAGDWTANGLDAGCLEAAITSGRLAAQAIAGTPAIDEIPGVTGPPGFPNTIDRVNGFGSRVIERIGSLPGAFGGLAGGAVKLAGVAVDAVPDSLMRRIPGTARLRRIR